MPRLSFKAANREDEFFAKREGRKGGLHLSRVPFEAPPSSSKGRRSFCRNSSSVSTALSIVSSRKSFSYDKLSQAPIHLTIFKLDGSSFGIEVIKMATISDLKQAVESYFSNLPTAETGKISWRHVWTQFCLSYRGQKLLIDSEYIRNYGVRDGDELRFVRHVSIAYNLIKKRSRKRIEASKPCTTTENKEEEISKVEEAFDDQENLSCQVEDNSSRSESMLSHLFRGWFLYSRVSNNDQLKFRGQADRSRWTGAGGIRGWFHFSDKRHPRYSSRVSQVEI
ncbi:uncharacterized protein LOC110705225 [Chenopodium quinoa]|uniref:uncharacterized protein LOC110705225 n=1 Tax=Chenopodium quinoa TaxID=63459 RepID=UPI000B78ED97|nr:uncharacterized protein LOC110705225 [Chenopodium quinoa]